MGAVMLDCSPDVAEIVTLLPNLLGRAKLEKHGSCGRAACLDGFVQHRAASPSVTLVRFEAPAKRCADTRLVEAAPNGVGNALENVSHLSCCGIEGFDARESPL